MDEFRRFFYRSHKLFDDFFEDFFPERQIVNTSYSFRPKLNINELNDRYEFYLAIPGFDKNDIEIDVNEDLLTIKSHKDFSEFPRNFIYKEMDYTNFNRQIHIPKDIDINNIKASLEKGILKIELMKKEMEKVRKIEIYDENDAIDITNASEVK
ncbi:MAG: Hsp20/alpha crystallin family protein [Candidatus Helarchaeota archaeon]